MLRPALIAAALAVAATPAAAKLAPGAKAPDFTAPAYLAGDAFTYKLADGLKKGPVVLYFFPSAYTAGCNLEARLFSEAVDEFKANGATVIGVTSGKTDKLAQFSKDTEHCGGKFPVAADPGAAIAKRYDAPLNMKGMAMPGMSGRVSYVIAPDGKVIHSYDNLDPNDHVNQTLGAVKVWKSGKRK
ncbi:peroxiredoxin [Phenylobacterium parvum]|uniref:thioredoxin-dependent peroxiredoxin n=1 Tax=Phenylobacterium parvum TaxID=2201350 RepID=A0A2Z3I1P3_9CAUL|nr:peroxiredoxin [Phenylobacterium parvum]AWM77354.1 peroxiredoxin [Phenylobacterium parvum]